MSFARSESSRRIDDAAAVWVARIDRGPLSDAEERELERWLDSDVRRRGAFAKANAVMAHTDRVRGIAPWPAADNRLTRYLSRRNLFFSGAAIAASAAAAVVLPKMAFNRPLLFQTIKGEIRHLPLSDGSSVTLNTQSALKVAYSPAQRDVALVSGEALFNVAKDRERPFVVRAGTARVRAVGTSFSVRLDASGAVRVMVSEGVVEISQDGQAHPVRAAANVVATVMPPSAIESPAQAVATQVIEPQEISRGLAWRDGMLSFDGQTLAEAAAEFDRYSATRIVVDDAQLSRQTLTGLFSANDPLGFAKAVASSLNGRVSQSGDEVHIYR